ncbi:MAG: ATP phosphoribosyltransferase regulatory subunit [Oscillospiraceae bacterium]|jgi:ATP phosphoribosyltransferase regulatory subunit|nr:ATP phosphoribosyltransferase regulatory subunit [Oscillospiraceae bacterium]
MPTDWVGAPEGARDKLFGACQARRALENSARALFARFGYAELMTPALERGELFERTGLPMPAENMCRFVGRDGRLVVMRPDSTAPAARVAAARLAGRPMPLRLYYIQDIYRADDEHTGRPAEIRQAGVELIGAPGRRADLEVLSLAARTLFALGVADFRIELGHAALFRALSQRLDIDGADREELRALIEQKNFAALGDRLSGFENRPVREAIGRLCMLFGGREVFREAGLLGVPEADAALNDLKETYAALENAGFGGRIQIDLGLVHQMDYYTGVVFRGYAAGVGRAVLTGGRYDNLMGALGRSAPATGFAVDLDALCDRLPVPEAAGPETLIHFSPEHLQTALALLDTRPRAELSPCGTLAASRALARARNLMRLINADADGEEESL